MYPVILRFSWFTLYSYGVMISAGFILAIFYFLKSTRSANLPQDLMLNLVGGVIFFALVGARIFYILTHLKYYLFHPQEIYQIWEGGMVLYGGLFLSLLFSLYYIKAHNLSFGKISDCAAPAIALGFSIGRIGCFLNGCCYGIPSKFGFIFLPTTPAGVAFPDRSLFPVQLVSSVNLLLIFLILNFLKKKNRFSQRLLALFFIFYSSHRFLVEFIRADTPHFILNLTLFQMISFALGTFSIIWLINPNWRFLKKYCYFLF